MSDNTSLYLPEILKALLTKVSNPSLDLSEKDAIVLIAACHNVFNAMKKNLKFKDFDFQNEEDKSALLQVISRINEQASLQPHSVNQDKIYEQGIREFYRQNNGCKEYNRFDD